jgi:hypothetical protein
LELIDVLYETAPGSQPVTRFQENGGEGKAAFSLQHRTEGWQKKVLVWSFLKNIEIINIEDGKVPNMNSISFITDDNKDLGPFAEWRTSKTSSKALVKARLSGEISRQLKKERKKYHEIKPLWKSKGRLIVQKNKGDGESQQLLEGSSRRFYPLAYTSFSIHFSTREDPEFENYLELEVVYIYLRYIADWGNPANEIKSTGLF